MTNEAINIKDFWKPIEECPKEKDHFYFLLSGDFINIGTWECNDFDKPCWCDQDIYRYPNPKFTHYAEIPPLPEEGE